jgi:hypothetical protein
MRELIENIQEHVILNIGIIGFMVIVLVISLNQVYHSSSYYPEMLALELLAVFVYVAIIIEIFA